MSIWQDYIPLAADLKRGLFISNPISANEDKSNLILYMEQAYLFHLIDYTINMAEEIVLSTPSRVRGLSSEFQYS